MSVFGFFRSVFPRIRAEHGELLRISPYLVRMRENTDQKISEYGYLLRSGLFSFLNQKSYSGEVFYWQNSDIREVNVVLAQTNKIM